MKAKTDGTVQTALDFIWDIIHHEMSDVDQDRITIFNQQWKIPKDDGLYILISSKGSKVFANRTGFKIISSVPTEVNCINSQEIIAVEIMSRNQDAINRKEEILMALNSLYSQQVQEAKSFRIFRLGNIEQLSDLEGSAMLNRYEISVTVHAWFEKSKTASYYETFKTRVKTEEDTVNFDQETPTEED